jgi:hypothetical protein
MRIRTLALVVCGVLSAAPSSAQAGTDEIPLRDVKNDRDTIRISVEEGKVAKDEVEFVLKLAPALHHHKKIKAFSATGAVGEIEVRDDIKEAKFTQKINTLDRVELGKGCFPFETTHWDYKISDLRSKGGCRIIVSWEKD